MEPVIMPIEDVLDLHTFRPKDVPDLLDDYFTACREKQLFTVRIIHGKGQGILKKHVRAVLARHPLVLSFTDAPPEAGGWGATLVNLIHA
jgi:DNA-nicking Smr family endonuclease